MMRQRVVLFSERKCSHAFRFSSSFFLFDLCRLQNDQVFCQMISKRSNSLRSNFLNFLSQLRFLFRARFVHAIVTLNSDRRYYKKRDDDQKEWSTNDVSRVIFALRAKNALILSHHSLFFICSIVCLRRILICLSWSSFLVCLAEVTVRHARELFIVRRFMHSWECSVSYYQSFFISVSLEKSTSSSLVWASLRCLNCSSSLVARRYLNTLTINSKMFKRVIKFVSRLFAHIFFRRSSNFEHFSSVWCIVCLRTSQKHFENSIVFILWR
jgi:hypothetical protein